MTYRPQELALDGVLAHLLVVQEFLPVALRFAQVVLVAVLFAEPLDNLVAQRLR